MHIRYALEQLGYSPHEVEVYLASLQLGSGTITRIAEKAKLARTTVTEVASALHRKGLMNSYLVRRRKVWTAVGPEKLVAKLKERETILKLILPQLQSMQRDVGAKAAIQTYSGTDEIRQIMNDILTTKRHFSVMLGLDEWIKFLGKAFMNDFMEMCYQQFLKVKAVTPHSAAALRLKQKDVQELRTTRFLPDFASGIKSSTFIYGNKVAIVSLNARRPVGVIIEDRDVANSMAIFFESLWRQSEKE